MGIRNFETFDTDQIVAEVWTQKQAYFNERAILISLEEEVNKLVAKNELSAATDLLEQKINSGTKITSSIWKDYAQYMVWQERSTEVWKTLEKHYQANRTKRVADQSRTIGLQFGYPSESTRELWLTRQLQWNTKDVAVLEDYVKSFNTPGNRDYVLECLKKLAEYNPSLKRTNQYIDHILYAEFQNKLDLLNAFEPCHKKYHSRATEIAWAYANENLFEKALEWEKCTDQIPQETVDFWMVSTGNFEDLRHNNYERYIRLLLSKDPKRALIELQNSTPCQENLVSVADKIAMAYAEIKLFREAQKWAECSEGLPIAQPLLWHFELKEYDAMKKVYQEYIFTHPEDYETKLLMGELLLYSGFIDESATLGAQLPKGAKTDELIAKINKEIKNMGLKEQRQLLKTAKDIVYQNVRTDILKNIRKEEGNSISANAFSVNDKDDPTILTAMLSANLYDKKFNIHSVSAVRSIVHPLNAFPTDTINSERAIWGAEYRFRQALGEKRNFYARARLERDDQNKMYYQAALGVNFNGEVMFNNLSVDYFPVRSGPGYALDLYRAQLNSYNEIKISERIRQVISLEANYYSDNEMGATLVGRWQYAIGKPRVFTLSPLVEASYALGTADRRSGFPYWMAEKRSIAGAGLALNIGHEKSKFSFVGDASMFVESNQPNYERYTGNLSARFFEFTTLRAGFEFYTLENFYSNVFNLGLIYNFK
jgi:Ni,Fe-hydrogenase III component G